MTAEQAIWYGDMTRSVQTESILEVGLHEL